MIIIGVNTGTSADAVDTAAFLFEGSSHQLVAATSTELPAALKKNIMTAVESPDLSVADLYLLRGHLTQVYIQAIQKLVQVSGLKQAQITAIGLHGQTIHHHPRQGYPYTIQLADAASVAEALGCPVVENFRQSDMAVGGEGAPLIPAYHRHIAQQQGLEQCLFLNLGGIANITLVDRERLCGWDAGPANALIDFWVGRKLQQPYDDQGKWAASGQVKQALLEKWLKDPYFSKTPPKSTGRDYFSGQWLLARIDKESSPVDVQATLCELTVRAVCDDLVHHVKVPKGTPLYLFGKGVKNNHIISRLSHHLPHLSIQSTHAIGLDPDWLESGLFAWLAKSRLEERAIDLTQVTGATRPAVLGAIYQSARML